MSCNWSWSSRFAWAFIFWTSNSLVSCLWISCQRSSSFNIDSSGLYLHWTASSSSFPPSRSYSDHACCKKQYYCWDSSSAVIRDYYLIYLIHLVHWIKPDLKPQNDLPDLILLQTRYSFYWNGYPRWVFEALEDDPSCHLPRQMVSYCWSLSNLLSSVASSHCQRTASYDSNWLAICSNWKLIYFAMNLTLLADLWGI